MNWFGYVWVVCLILAYIVWTVKSLIDFIRDLKGCFKLSYIFNYCEPSWGWWIVLHIVALFLGSLIYFICQQ